MSVLAPKQRLTSSVGWAIEPRVGSSDYAERSDWWRTISWELGDALASAACAAADKAPDPRAAIEALIAAMRLSLVDDERLPSAQRVAVDAMRALAATWGASITVFEEASLAEVFSSEQLRAKWGVGVK